ncbi:MAG: hypothetical protein ABIU95_04110, partial [Burkholderiales bacterium]
LGRLVRTMNEQRVIGVLRQPHEPSRDADFLAQRTGARVVVMAASVGAVPAATDYFAMLDYNLTTLARLAATR